METEPVALGNVICSRRFTLYTSAGEPRLITISLGAPFETPTSGSPQPGREHSTGFFRCPFQIVGLGNDARIYGIAGEDPFVALQYAIDFIGELLNDWSSRSGLLNRHQRCPSTKDTWIWRYPAHPDEPPLPSLTSNPT